MNENVKEFLIGLQQLCAKHKVECIVGGDFEIGTYVIEIDEITDKKITGLYYTDVYSPSINFRINAKGNVNTYIS